MTSDGSGAFSGRERETDPAGPIQPGVELAGRYRVDRAIARGGMAMVYRGYDLLLAREVAIKVLGTAAASATGSQREFLREARAAAALSHPNIVGVYDAGVHGAERYIVMEYVPNGSLYEVIQTRAPLPPAEVIPIATQLANAVDYGHRRGIVHCDVKPQNVLLDEAGHPKLVDFGISRSIAATGALTDSVTGTAGYIAPEQLLGERLDGRVDVYSLGCVVYEMLSGDLPFDAPSLAALATQRLVRPPIPLRDRNPGVPLSLAAAVMRALEREPDQRYQSAEDFARALEQAVPARPSARAEPVEDRLTSRLERGDRPAVARPRMPTSVVAGPARVRAARQQRRHLFWPLTLVALAVLLVAGAVAASELPSLFGGAPAAAVVVPDVQNQQLDQAATLLHARGLQIAVQFQPATGSLCTGDVVGQNPAPRAQIHGGDTVTLVVSRNLQC